MDSLLSVVHKARIASALDFTVYLVLKHIHTYITSDTVWKAIHHFMGDRLHLRTNTTMLENA
jgi:hypothetical protein